MHVPAASPFFDKTYRETVSLLEETRDYVKCAEQRNCMTLTMIRRLELTCEAWRVTSRLTQIMAWMLVQRALLSGEISPEEAYSERYRISGDTVCAENIASEDKTLPQGIRTLLERSHSLYWRVRRLEEMVQSRYMNPNV